MATALVLARRRSKSMPGKNLLEFHGRPLVAYPVMAAREAGLAAVLLSDGAELLAVGEQFGARTHRLPAELCTDTGTIHASLDHAIAALGLAEETVVALMGNSPTVCGATIRRALARHEAGDVTGVLTVAPVEDVHPWRLWQVAGERVRPFLGEVPRAAINRQACAGCVRYDGGPMVFRGSYRPGPSIYPFLGAEIGCVVRDEFGLDVHTPADLSVATWWLWLHRREWLPADFEPPGYFAAVRGEGEHSWEASEHG